MTTTQSGWLELAVECDTEAVEPVSELFARYGYNEGVVVEEPFTQDPDGDNMALDHTRPVTVRTFLALADTTEETLDQIRKALWALGKLRHVGDLTITERAEEDWANAWKEHYYTHRIGERVTVRPPWRDNEVEPEPDQVMIVLDPGMAFGTGLHPSTRLGVLALEQTLQTGDRVLDVGTGSGILAIAAAKLGAASVDAVDIEPVAVRSTRENAERNGVASQITADVGSVGPDQPFTGSYDLVLANIIARILIDLSADLARAVAPGGTLILSGIISMREPAVRRTFDGLGLEFDRQIQIDDWLGMIYRRPATSQETNGTS
jgi:ribosomal protein L11 methyltransferase